jgi:hypothetical protein
VVSASIDVLVELMPNGFRDRLWFIRLVLALWFVSSLFGAFILYQLNGVVHGTLYNYGLQFSSNWAEPYWNLERLLYVCLFVPSSLGGFALGFDLWRSHVVRVPTVKRAENNVAPGKVSPHVQTAARDNSMTISCPKCRALFGRPMNMLDFSSGKAQLINVCPYCNQVLGAKEHDNVTVRIAEPDEEEVLKRR